MKKILAVFLTLLMAVSALTACDYEITITKKETEASTNENGEIVTEAQTKEEETEEFRAEHSDLFWRAKANWSEDAWYNKNDWDEQDFYFNKFQTLASPFRFLKEQGVVYGSQGNYTAYGNEDFNNNECIEVYPYIDKTTQENDLYILMQYCSDEIDRDNSNGDTYVATWMLKYTLPDDVYKDLLLYQGDWRQRFIFQQIDQEYTPEIISKSVINYDLLDNLRLFNSNKSVIIGGDGVKYIEKIDYNNLTLTVNESNKGKISSYTYYLKDSPTWNNILSESILPPEQIENWDVDDYMPTYMGETGRVLDNFCILGYVCRSTDEFKASATLKYDLTPIGGSILRLSSAVNSYEDGKRNFENVNELTREFYESKLAESEK